MKEKIVKLIEQYEMIIGYTSERLVGDSWTSIEGTKLDKLINAQLEEKINSYELVIKDLKELL